MPSPAGLQRCKPERSPVSWAGPLPGYREMPATQANHHLHTLSGESLHEPVEDRGDRSGVRPCRMRRQTRASPEGTVPFKSGNVEQLVPLKNK